jgi:polysaccharide biosynthesis protein PslA
MNASPAPRPPADTDEPWIAAARALRDSMHNHGGASDADLAAEDRRGPLRPERLSPLRNRIQARLIGRLFRMVDAGSLTALAIAGVHISSAAGWANATLAQVGPFAIAGVMLAWLLNAMGTYRFPLFGRLWTRLARITAVFLSAALILTAGLWLLTDAAPAASLTLWFGLAYLSLLMLHSVWWTMVRSWKDKAFLTPNVVIVGATEAADRLITAALKTREVNVIGVFDDRAGRVPSHMQGVPVLGDLDALIGHRIMPYVDQIVIAVTAASRNRVKYLGERLAVLPNEISLVVDNPDENAPAVAITRIANAPLSRVAGVPTDERRAALKRLQDLGIGSLALVLLGPVMVAVAALIKLDSPGPIFFRQRRHGFNNEEILVWKFRSMRHEMTDHTASRQVTGDDDRVTSVGRFIRRTSLDELPQLFNVLAGEMSLVGPRPHAVGMKTGDTETSRLVAEYAHRHRLKPGMTGWAAVNGSRGPVDTPELVQRRVSLDIDYIERQSFWLDIYIMAMTIPCLLGDRHVVR